MDHFIGSLPQEYGAIFNNTAVQAIAFADNLVLLTDSPTSLQHLLDCGLMLNNTESHTVAIF